MRGIREWSREWFPENKPAPQLLDLRRDQEATGEPARTRLPVSHWRPGSYGGIFNIAKKPCPDGGKAGMILQ